MVANPQPLAGQPAGLSKSTILAAATVASFMMFLDTTVVNVALEGIRRSFTANLAGLQWVVDGYALTLASLLLSAGSISDRAGSRRTFLIGLGVFTSSSLVCGAANELSVLVLARAVQGVGGALILPSSLALISRAYPLPAERSKALAIWGALGGGVALSAGPVIGGWLTSGLGWRSVFFINVPVGLIVLWLTWRIRGGEATGSNRRTDWGGQIVAVSTLTALTFLFIEGPNLGWTSPAAVVSFLLTVIGTGTFLAIEARAVAPMLPLELFRNREFTFSSLIGYAINFSFYGQLFFMSVYLQQSLHLTPAQTGWRFVPETLAAPCSTLLLTRLGKWLPAQRSLLIGVSVCATGLASMAVLGLRGNVALDSLLMVLIGVGAGAPTFLVAVMLGSVSTARSGLAAGALSAARQVGGLLGVALLGGVVGHSVNDAGVRLALAITAGTMVGAAILAARLRSNPAHAVDMNEAAAEALA